MADKKSNQPTGTGNTGSGDGKKQTTSPNPILIRADGHIPSSNIIGLPKSNGPGNVPNKNAGDKSK